MAESKQTTTMSILGNSKGTPLVWNQRTCDSRFSAIAFAFRCTSLLAGGVTPDHN